MTDYLYADAIDCQKSGSHLTSCDDDGYCNLCGCQEWEDNLPIDMQIAHERGANTSYDDRD